MHITCDWTEDPVELYCKLILNFGNKCTGYVGDCEARTSVFVESTLGYHTFVAEVLTMCAKRGIGQCQLDSLTGAVAS